MKRLIFIFSIIIIPQVYAKQYQLKIGTTLVTIATEQNGSGPAFIHLHQNETTALKAARAVMQQKGGSILTLVHPGGRNIVFYLDKTRYEFDPNRIFSDVGIKKTLMNFGKYNYRAHVEVKQLSDKIKMLLPAGTIIAVHNNNNYSLQDYLPRHDLEAEARALYVNSLQSVRNFYLVTQQQDYNYLHKMRFNSVWQKSNATDDGSLSVFLSNRRYINVEAGYDQFAAQRSMLTSLVGLTEVA